MNSEPDHGSTGEYGQETGGHSADDAPDESAFYRMPDGSWSDVDETARELLTTLSTDLRATLHSLSGASGQSQPQEKTPESGGIALEPTVLALRLGEAAALLFSSVAGPSGDLRQVITTMRTALAVCWDMYSADETARVSVRQHMERLQSTITDFEAELREMNAE